MAEQNTADVADRPICSKDHDLLGREPFVESLAKALVEKQIEGTSSKIVATGHVIGLTGEWGAGKSSLLNLLNEELGRRDRVIVVLFNPWLFSGRDDLLDGFFNELASKLGKTAKEQRSDILKTLDKYRGAVGAGAAGAMTLAPVDLGISSRVANAVIPKHRPSSAQESRVELEKKLAALKAAVVVLIDELDRVEDDEVRAVARLVKAVGDIKGISYLVAYDPKRVVAALGHGSGDQRTASGEAYLEKIIQLVIPIRPLLDYEMISMLQAALSERGYDPGHFRTQRADELWALLSRAMRTPRDVKRLIGNFAAIEPMVRGEVNPLDVLGYCYLLVKAQSVRDAIASDLDSVVSDPEHDEAIARALKRKVVTIDEIFGALAKPHENILKWLFPIFGSDRETGFDRDRIKWRRNLLRLLYLGNPPHDVPREEVDQVWGLDADATEASLRELARAGKLRAFVERFRDLWPSLPSEGDVAFWRGLARALIRDHDWTAGPEPQKPVTDDLETLLRIFATENPASCERVKAIVGALIADGDLIIAPALLRSHLFRYGLTPDGMERPDIPAVFSEEEIKALIPSESARYAESIKSGNQLRRIPDADAIYFLLNIGAYDADLREVMTRQLDGAAPLKTLASLLVPPGYLIEAKTLNELLDSERVLPVLEAEWEAGTFNAEDAWVQSAVRRLRKILRREDPHFD